MACCKRCGALANGRTANSTHSRRRRCQELARRSCQSRSGSEASSACSLASRGHLMLLFDIVLPGLVLGGMYALIALGLTLQYGVARVMNLSYGESLIAAAFGAL